MNRDIPDQIYENIPKIPETSIEPILETRPNTEDNLIDEIAQKITESQDIIETKRVRKLISPLIAEKLKYAIIQGPNGETTVHYDIEWIITELREIYPTVSDIVDDLSQCIKNAISVKKKEDENLDEHKKRVENERLQYEKAIEPLIDGLKLIYEEFGSRKSLEMHERIIQNIGNVVKDIIEGKDDGLFQMKLDYFQENIVSALEQDWNKREKREIKELLKPIFESLKMKEGIFSESSKKTLLVNDLENLITKLGEEENKKNN